MAKLFKRSESPYWYAEIEVAGGTRRISTGVPCSPSTRGKAREAAEQKRAELSEEAEREQSASLSQAWLVFHEHNGRIKQSTLNHYEAKIAVVIHTLKDPALAAITPEMLRLYVKARRSQTSDIQIRRELTALSSVLDFAAERDLDGAPEINPTKLIRKKSLAQPTKKPRWISPDDMQRLLEAATGTFWPFFIRLVLETGMRHEEVLGLCWKEVDLDRRVILLEAEREKTSRGRLIPLTSTAVNTLGALKRYPHTDYVFVNPKTRKRYTSIWKGWGKLRVKAKVPEARIHDLRHTFASWTRQHGMSKEDRMTIMGHNNEASHAGYAFQSADTLIGVLEKHSPSTLLSQSRKS